MANPKEPASTVVEKKRAKPFNSYQASKKYMEAKGYAVGKVEQVIPHTFIKRDLFNMFDAICIKAGEPIIGLQMFTIRWTEHEKYIRENELFPVWCATGSKVIMHGWRKIKDKKAKKGYSYQIREGELVPDKKLPLDI